jgi:hypothetical protein
MAEGDVVGEEGWRIRCKLSYEGGGGGAGAGAAEGPLNGLGSTDFRDKTED